MIKRKKEGEWQLYTLRRAKFGLPPDILAVRMIVGQSRGSVVGSAIGGEIVAASALES
jgi:hypothetical protein